MERIILKDIENLASRLGEEYHRYHNYLEIYHQREKRRITNPPSKKILIPEEWGLDQKFNPFYVLKHRRKIARSISKKILNGTYKPNQPFKKEIPKKNGGKRSINIYQIPDSAVSYRFYKNLLNKNKHRFSSLSYAYRNDRNVHFAIQDISNELESTQRIFIAEYDFSNFFGSIQHKYIYEQFDKNAFLISTLERQIIKAFLGQFEIGIPLGTSISLFIANLVCWNLDRQLENAGIRFARYADDTIIWSTDYLKICKAAEIINSFSSDTGIKINYQKSEGINLLQMKGIPSEFFNTKEFIEFLGYRISVETVGIKNDSVNKIKKQVSYILYRNLIQPVKSKPFKGVNIPSNNIDHDFLTAIMQIRRYLYGNLTEITLKKFLNGTYKRLSFKGIMSFYPLINDEEQLKELDRWLISTILNVLRKRNKLFKAHNPQFNSNQFPFNKNKNELIDECKNKEVYNHKGLFEIPSFLRIYLAIKLGLINQGIEGVMHPKSLYYYE